jgi:uncharacterized protein
VNMVRVIQEFLWTLRRAGIELSVPQVLDAFRTVLLVGFDDRVVLKQALACVVVQRKELSIRYSSAFERFFSPHPAHSRDFFRRLQAQGFDAETLQRLQEVLQALAQSGAGNSAHEAHLVSLLLGGADLYHALLSSQVQRLLEPMTSRQQLGFYSQKVLSQVGISKAPNALRRWNAELLATFGEQLGGMLIQALSAELELIRAEIRSFVELNLELSEAKAKHGEQSLRDCAFAQLKSEELEEVRRAVRALGQKLRGAARVRWRHAQHGRIHLAATMRSTFRTGGVPMVPKRKKKRNRAPKLMVLCDISDSVRYASLFMLEFVAVVQDLFAKTRSFVFVSELGETTDIFASQPLEKALRLACGGAVIPMTSNSNYGRAFQMFESQFGKEIDKRTTVVVVGDGRTNYRSPALDVVERIRSRARSLLWLCPESKARWGSSDSAMLQYAKHVTRVLEASTANELELAARSLVVR